MIGFSCQVYCIGHAFDPAIDEKDDDDSGVVVMKFPSGVIATIDVSRVSNCGHDMSFAIHGERKSLYSQTGSRDGLSIASSDGITKSVMPPDFQERFEKAFKREWSHFYECITGYAT